MLSITAITYQIAVNCKETTMSAVLADCGKIRQMIYAHTSNFYRDRFTIHRSTQRGPYQGRNREVCITAGHHVNR